MGEIRILLRGYEAGVIDNLLHIECEHLPKKQKSAESLSSFRADSNEWISFRYKLQFIYLHNEEHAGGLHLNRTANVSTVSTGQTFLKPWQSNSKWAQAKRKE